MSFRWFSSEDSLNSVLLYLLPLHTGGSFSCILFPSVTPNPALCPVCLQSGFHSSALPSLVPALSDRLPRLYFQPSLGAPASPCSQSSQPLPCPSPWVLSKMAEPAHLAHLSPTLHPQHSLLSASPAPLAAPAPHHLYCPHDCSGSSSHLPLKGIRSSAVILVLALNPLKLICLP